MSGPHCAVMALQLGLVGFLVVGASVVLVAVGVDETGAEVGLDVTGAAVGASVVLVVGFSETTEDVG